MDVILFRHGIAVDAEHWKGDDATRPLTPAGADRTKQGAQGLGRLKVQPDHMFSSPLIRARQTAELVKAELALQTKIELVDDLRPDAPPDALLARLATLPARSVVLCVGHEPHLSTAMSLMISGKTAASIEMKKAAAGSVGFVGVPKAGVGTLQWLLPPRTLRVLGRSS
jgi:phosphohistidine phosphatase